MNLQFFPRTASQPSAPSPFVSINRKGIIALNAETEKLINAELGEAAALCYDRETGRWLLAHWPQGDAGQCQLRLPGGKNSGLRFSQRAACAALFARQPAALLSLRCALAPAAILDAALPNTRFYALELPATAAPEAVRAPRVKEPGVGRGNYTRTANRTAA